MAHIPDGFLSPPVIACTTAASAVALGLAARRSRNALGEQQAPLLGATTAFVFAAQMFNFPLGAGTSAHLLGGVLVAVLAGPWAGMLAIFSVVLVQALLFQDGGITALGANTLNMAVLGAGGGWLIYRWGVLIVGDGARSRVVAAAVAAFVSALVTGVAAGLELGLSGVVPVRTAVLAVGGAHIPVGATEALITAGIVSMILRSRPDLVTASGPVTRRYRRAALAGTAAAGLALAAATWASNLPDALESAAAATSMEPAHDAAPAAAPLAGYTAPFGGAWVAGVVGVAVVFGVAWFIFRLASRTREAA